MGDLEEKEVEEYLEETEVNPPFRFTRTFDEDDYEVVDEEELGEGPSREELQKEIERQKAELETARLKASGLGKEDLMEVLRAVQKGTATPPPVPQQQRGETDEEFLKRLNEKLFEAEGGPGNLIIEAVKRFSGQAAAPGLQGSFEMSKELVEGNPDLGPVYREYRDEVEEVINQTPMNQRMQIPHIYKRATEEVARRHWKDLRTKGVEELVKTEVEKMRKELGLSEGGERPSGPIYSESSINRPKGAGPSGGKVKKKIPKPTAMEEKYANSKGVTWPQLYETLKGNPQLKKRINEGGIPWLR